MRRIILAAVLTLAVSSTFANECDDQQELVNITVAQAVRGTPIEKLTGSFTADTIYDAVMRNTIIVVYKETLSRLDEDELAVAADISARHRRNCGYSLSHSL